MYIYKRAVGINLVLPKGEEPLDIAEIPVNQLSTKFSDLLIIMLDGIANTEVVLKAEDYTNDFTGYVGTIQDWLDSNSDIQLVTSNQIPSDKFNYVTTHDIEYLGFTLVPGDARLATDRQDFLNVTGARDIRVVKVGTKGFNYKQLYENTLWTINGHLVKSILGEDAIYLVNAGRHFNINDNIHVNCLNFNLVSRVETHSIKEDNIRITKNGSAINVHYKHNQSLRDKTVWLSIGGRLFKDDLIETRSDNSLSIRTDLVDWFSLIFDSKDLIDLSSVIEQDREVVGSDFFSTEEFLLNLLTDNSSFVIVLDNPKVFTETVPIVTYQYPFTFETNETKPIPLITGNGLLPKYSTRVLLNRRLLDIDIGVKKKYVNKTSGVGNGGDLFHGYTNRVRPSNLHKGYLLYIRGLNRET